MLDLQSVLVLVGSLAVIGIIIHGLWLSKKEKKSKFAQAREETGGKIGKGASSSVSPKSATSKARVEPEPLHVAESSHAPKKAANASKSRQEPGFSQLEPSFSAEDDDDLNDPLFRAASAVVPGSRKVMPSAPVEPTISSPNEAKEDDLAMHVEPSEQASSQNNSTLVGTETQLEPKAQFDETNLNFSEQQKDEPAIEPFTLDEDASEQAVTAQTDEPIVETSNEQITADSSAEIPEPMTIKEIKEVKAPEPEYIVVNVHTTSDSRPFTGTELFEAMRQVGLQYGDMDIFHRYLDGSESRKPLFSVANMLNPGTFAHTDPAQFSTKGVSFFMGLPCQVEAKQNFKLMLEAAQQLADHLSANVLDEKRNLMTPDRIAAYQEQIRDFCLREKIYNEYKANLSFDD